jgi:superfamily II DNA or RNA helicase
MLSHATDTLVQQRFPLRPYQKACVQRILTVYRRKPEGGRALIVLPTGCGKTIVFTEVARQLGLTTLVIAHRQELLQQAADKFHVVAPMAAIGQVGAGRHEYGANITIASIQTLCRPEHLEQLPQFGYGLVIIDEAHHAIASGYQAVLKALPRAFVLGVTATPDRLDGQRIEHIFGEPLYRVPLIDMIEQGYLCDLRAIAVKTQTSLDNLRTRQGDYQIEELAGVIDSPERNQQIVDAFRLHAAGRQALCFGATIEHAQHLADTFNRNGIPSAMISGDTAYEERTQMLRDYERGTLHVLCNCGVLTEGYDHAATSCIILARPTQSRALLVQMIGRGTRLAPGKEDCIILDITDNCFKHQLEPQTSKAALGITLANGESVREGCERVRRSKEKDDREQRQRTLVVDKRTQDVAVNILERLEWHRQPDGSYTLVLDRLKHRIVLLPAKKQVGYYEVRAQLASSPKSQRWLEAVPLDWAQQFAERQARMLLADPANTVLVDRTARWRKEPFDPDGKQAGLLRKVGIPMSGVLTKGEASDLLTRHFAEQERRRMVRKPEAQK